MEIRNWVWDSDNVVSGGGGGAALRFDFGDPDFHQYEVHSYVL
jgi:hypothetical protein